jgi:hypothetical protein
VQLEINVDLPWANDGFRGYTRINAGENQKERNCCESEKFFAVDHGNQTRTASSADHGCQLMDVHAHTDCVGTENVQEA